MATGAEMIKFLGGVEDYETKRETNKKNEQAAAAKQNVQWAGNALDREDYVPYLQKVYDKGIKSGRPMTVIGEALDLGRGGDDSGGREILRQFYRDGMRNKIVPETERTRKLAGFGPSLAEQETVADIKYKEGQTSDIAIDNLREQLKMANKKIVDMQAAADRQQGFGLEQGRLDVSQRTAAVAEEKLGIATAEEERAVTTFGQEQQEVARTESKSLEGLQLGLENINETMALMKANPSSVGFLSEVKTIGGGGPGVSIQLGLEAIKSAEFGANIDIMRDQGRLSDKDADIVMGARKQLSIREDYDATIKKLTRLQELYSIAIETAPGTYQNRTSKKAAMSAADARAEIEKRKKAGTWTGGND